MWCVATVGSREDVAATSGRAARSPVAGRAAVGKSGDDRGIALDVAFAIAGSRADALRLGELALKELPAAHDRAKRIARDQEA